MKRRPYDAVKRALDIVGAAIGLVLVSPIIAIIAVLVATRLGRPVIFRHSRPGRNARIFTLVKFRTMLPVDESRGWVGEHARMTAFGSRLRSTSLDELPTLWNVLRGDMSFVGPRPLHVRYLGRYTATQARRHDVRPGVTGWAQVNGRNSIDWGTKLAYDVDYVRRRSLRLDATILLRTVATVLRRDGITAAGHPTISEFLGAPDVPVPSAVSRREEGSR